MFGVGEGRKAWGRNVSFNDFLLKQTHPTASCGTHIINIGHTDR